MSNSNVHLTMGHPADLDATLQMLVGKTVTVARVEESGMIYLQFEKDAVLVSLVVDYHQIAIMDSAVPVPPTDTATKQ